ncbi:MULTISPECIES: ABC transporter permease [unclassified Sulfitobacter]|uniref:ABC transporter permease n=1 Tax=unclassified Sulfitobacter TaxID=196795 RepID=UPI0007C4054E|nr:MULTISPECIES: ABC transporter permease [unclassified Sulfitobacter]KZY03550.1 D-ala-D-ala transporter subunit [Sulfitobacter sp. HI0023]KZY25712.1 D-ala-D-ala transporter subunit [Sulfitobacter sp. HI0040]KZZ67177.1 D-ala-D-ala transporter subunit [Sulfitobacter sp. HI0129]
MSAVGDMPRPGRLGQIRASMGRLPVTAQIGIVILLFWAITVLTVQFWPIVDPLMMAGRRLQPPSGEHWLGTDALGRDVLSRTLHGAAYTIPVAVMVVVAAVIIGSALGAISGYYGGWLDAVIMRAADVTLSFPPILLAMTVAATLGPGLPNAGLAMIIVWWPIYARLMRAQVLEVRTREHVEAAIAGGAGRGRVLVVHILPLCWTPTLINATMDFGQVALLAASLSFIGLGAVPPSPEWGSMISEGAAKFYSWWIAAGPGMAILSVVLATSFLGDGLRDILDRRAAA